MKLNITRNRKLAVLAVAVLVTAALVGTTLAYLMSKKTITNEFVPVTMGSEITEDFDEVTKENVKVKNTGTTTVYVRADIKFNWVNADGEVYYLPVSVADLDIAYNTEEGVKWFNGEDGYWYFSLPLAGGEETQVLLESCALKTGVTAPEGYHLSVDVTSETVQATPSQAVESAWPCVTVDQNGNIIK